MDKKIKKRERNRCRNGLTPGPDSASPAAIHFEIDRCNSYLGNIVCIESSILLCSALCVCLCVLLIQIIGISYPTSLKVSTLETLALLSGGEGKEGFRLAKGKKAEEDSVGLYIQNIEKGKDEEKKKKKHESGV